MTSSDDFSILDSPSDAPTRDARGAVRPEPPSDSRHSNVSGDAAACDDEDRRLVARLLDRDAGAWTEFLRRFERLIASRVMSTCREVGVEPRPELVEECGAELMANLFHADLADLRRFEGRSKLSTWLAVVARRTALGVIRRRLRDSDRLPRPDDSRFDLASIDDADGANPSLTDAEDREHLQAALQQLSEVDRRILAMQFEQQLSYAAIGRILGISENAVGPKLHRAQQRLKKLLRRRPDD